MSNWINIKDKLPEKVGLYLTFTNKNHPLVRIKRFEAVNIYSENKDDHRYRFKNGSGVEDKNVTHWMHLPSFPNEEYYRQIDKMIKNISHTLLKKLKLTRKD